MPQIDFNPAALEEIQLDLGLTDAELAAKIGVSERTLANWRAGSTQPSWPKIVAAARALEVEPSSLIVREVPA